MYKLPAVSVIKVSVGVTVNDSWFSVMDTTWVFPSHVTDKLLCVNVPEPTGLVDTVRLSRVRNVEGGANTVNAYVFLLSPRAQNKVFPLDLPHPILVTPIENCPGHTHTLSPKHLIPDASNVIMSPVKGLKKM